MSWSRLRAAPWHERQPSVSQPSLCSNKMSRVVQYLCLLIFLITSWLHNKAVEHILFVKLSAKLIFIFFFLFHRYTHRCVAQLCLPFIEKKKRKEKKRSKYGRRRRWWTPQRWWTSHQSLQSTKNQIVVIKYFLELIWGVFSILEVFEEFYLRNFNGQSSDEPYFNQAQQVSCQILTELDLIPESVQFLNLFSGKFHA